MAGYSGTPLLKKLGFKSPGRVALIDAPEEYPAWLGEVPPELSLTTSSRGPVDAVHLFVSSAKTLRAALPMLMGRIPPAGFIWVSWPKKSSGVATDIVEDTIREIALPLGLVDVKVCAVSDVWSGLKLVIRKSARNS